MKKKVFLAAAAALIVAVMASCGGDQKKLFLFNWIYYIPDDVITDFTKETGIEVVVDSYASNEEMYNKIVAGGSGYDLIVPSGDYVSIMIAEKLLEPIDKNKLKNFGNLDPAAIARIGFDKGNTHSVPYMMGAAGVSVNKTKVTNYEHSWNIFDKADIKGRMTMLDDMREVLGAALKSLGYSVNETNPAHLEEARLVVERWKPNLVKFDAESFAKSFASGEFWVVQGYAENVFLEYPEDKRADVDFFFPKEGTPMYMDSLCILKGAKHVDAAYKFIDYILRPDIAARIADYLMIPSPNVPARALMKVTPNYQFTDLAKGEFKEDLGKEVLKLYNDIWRRIRVGN
jgi:spermidine/putrescine transport system substrate-binding protein